MKQLSWAVQKENCQMYVKYTIVQSNLSIIIEIRERVSKEYLRRIWKLLEIKVSSRNLIKRINIWADPLVRYSGPFLKCIREELQQMDQRTRKLMTMHKALNPRDDIDRKEEDSPALKIAWIRQCDDSKTT